MTTTVAVIGGGPAGLMAAEVLLGAGISVDLYDRMPSLGRKLLIAGRGGLNLSHAEPTEAFLGRYGERRAVLQAHVDALGASEVRQWAAGLGIETFVGSSGRIFPVSKKAAPLLRAWLHRLRGDGLRIHVRHRWLGFAARGQLRFETPTGEFHAAPSATVLALGGGSWAKLGSDGAWVAPLTAAGVAIQPLRPANCGFELIWSDHFRDRCNGEPVKSVSARFEGVERRGEFVITRHGVEGSLIYTFSAALRDRIACAGHATLEVDLLPDWPAERVRAEVVRPRGSRSLSSHLQSRLGLKGVKAALLRECLGAEAFADPVRLSAAVKACPLRVTAPRPLDEAISSAGGVDFAELDAGLMLRRHPGVFCAGEMLDWEAPTGGYLLTASFATGAAAARGAVAWLAGMSSP
jgi:uncharacterized flavoprotein (TIGR03862 family)